MQFVLIVITNLLLSSLLLFLALRFLRPNIQISPFICRQAVDYDGVTRYYHFFKLINQSKFDACDVSIKLHLLSKYPASADGKMNTRYTALTLSCDTIPFIAKNPESDEADADNCITIRTADNLKRLLQDAGNSIVITVSLKHAFSGLIKVFKYEYAGLADIQEGKFAYGQKFACETEQDVQLRYATPHAPVTSSTLQQ